MKLMDWFPFWKKDEEAERPQSVPSQADKGFGPVTGRRLSELDCLTRPFVSDPFYRLRPPFSHRAAELSLELSQMTYTLHLEPWREAGWNDFSIQIDNTLQSGLTHGESATGERMQTIMNGWKVYCAKAALSERNPVSQIMGALRQRERSDTIKAVCMMHPLKDGHYMLAIGFMGTGKRLYDWISNFRFTTEEGFHKGFYQLCTYFEQGAENIVFPATAKALGLEKLTLGEVLSEMRSANSRFRLWMAGHSQGGAVMQIFTHRLLTQWGVLPQNMVGYGFASPTVATGALVFDPASYPLYHILNDDDMVPRMGALVHLGLCMVYPSNDAMREAVYGLSQLEADKAVYQRLRPFRDGMADIRSIFVYGAAFMETLGQEKSEENINQLIDKRWTPPIMDKALTFAGDKAMEWLSAFIKQLKSGYQDMIGKPMDDAEVHTLCEQMRPIVREVPLRRLMGGIASYTVPPHHLMRDQNEGAYTYIVTKDMEALQPFIWVKQNGGLPVKRYAHVSPEALAASVQQPTQVKRRARRSAARRGLPQGVRRTGYSARKQAR